MSRDSRLERFARLPSLEAAVGTLPPHQRDLWPRLGDIPDDFVLYGGTGLALHLGHRGSADFDFFSAHSFGPTDLASELSWLGRLTINESAPNHLDVSTETGVRLAFLGGMRLQAVAEPSLVAENGLVVASVFDLAGTKAKAVLDRSEWKDYLDIATLVQRGHRLADIIGYAATVFAPLFEFPAATFLRALVFFEEGTASEVPEDQRSELEAAVQQTEHEPIPIVEPYATSILP